MKQSNKKYVLLHTIFISLYLVFFLGSLLYLLINIIPIAYIIYGLVVGDKDAS